MYVALEAPKSSSFLLGNPGETLAGTAETQGESEI